MKLESVLSLKSEMSDEFLARVNSVPAVFKRAAGAATRTAAFAARLESTHTRSPNSVAVALGVAQGRRPGDYRLGARVQMKGRAGRAEADRLRARARGEADVRIVPEVRKRSPPTPAWFRRKRRPLEAGLSVGHFRVTAGTLGFIVEDRDAYYVLSNNHVLANVNDAEPGDPVVQPGPEDIRGRKKVTASTLIGVLDRYVPISFQRSNVVDCAIAALLPELEFYVGWTEALPGFVKGVKDVTFADLGRPVTKAGRTTGVRRGVITQVNVDRLQVDMGDENPRIAAFSDQIEIEGVGRPFSDGGDSGSLIVDADGFARALLFAGGIDEDTHRDLTFANQIRTVLQKLGVDLALR